MIQSTLILLTIVNKIQDVSKLNTANQEHKINISKKADR